MYGCICLFVKNCIVVFLNFNYKDNLFEEMKSIRVIIVFNMFLYYKVSYCRSFVIVK